MPDTGTITLSPDTLHDTGGVPKEHAGTELHIRALSIPFTRTQIVQLEDGDLLIKGVPMLAEGTWTDSAVGTPLFYPSKTLEAYAGNWIDTSGWNRHLGGVPRKSTDKVGEAENIRFENAAVTADVRVYGFTQTGRDLQEMIKRKLISFVSVEHGGDERMNPATRQMEASTLTFTGFAFVNKGACQKCRLNEHPPTKETPAIVPVEEPMTDTKELEAQIAGLTKELEAVKAQKPAEVKVEIPKELSALPGTIKELSDLVKAQAARIDALEKDGTPKTGAGQTKELEALPEFYVHVDRKNGIVGA
jgi:hypothetical protein